MWTRQNARFVMLTVPPLLARDRRIGTNAREGSDAFVWKAERLWIATDTAGIGLWSWNVDTDEIAMDDRAHALWGGREMAHLPSPTCRRALPHPTSTG